MKSWEGIILIYDEQIQSVFVHPQTWYDSTVHKKLSAMERRQGEGSCHGAQD